MGISQYHMNYSADEDRIFIFVRDDGGVEHAFGLTRQLFKKLWPALGTSIQEMSDTVARTAPDMKKDVLRIEQEGAVSQAIQTGMVTNDPLPGVEKRITYLVKTIRIADSPQGGKALSLSDGTQSMNIPINYDQLLIISDALRALVKGSDWNLNPLYPWEEAGGGETGEAPGEAAPAPTRH